MKRILISFLFLIFVLYKTGYCQASMTAGSGFFPYSFNNDDKSPRYTKFRAEGSNLSQIILHSVKYLRKYKNKKTTSSSSEIKYFDDQTKIFKWITEHKNSEIPGNYIRIGLVGDIMWIRDNWNSFVDKAVIDEMQSYDLLIGNLETLIDKNKKVRSFLPDYFKYNSDTGLVCSFYKKDKTSLFKVISIANNHIFDAGEKGTIATIEFLNSQDILSSGINKNKNDKPYVTFTVNNIKFGFYAACWGVNNQDKLEKSGLKLNIIKGIAPIGKGNPDLSEVKNVLKEMESEGIDFKIISLHWGAEYELYPDVQQIIIAREIVEDGADLIVGHHPHVIQPFDVYFVNGYEVKYKNDSIFNNFSPIKLNDGSNKPRKALVLYSLGNYTTEMFTELCQKGVMFGIKVYRNKENLIDWDVYKISYVVNEKNGGQKRRHILTLKN